MKVDISDPIIIGLILVIVSILCLVGGKIQYGDFIFDVNTGVGKVNIFLTIIGLVGLAIIIFDYVYFLNK